MKHQTARVFVRQSEFGHPRHGLEQMVNNHPFNSRLQIIGPFGELSVEERDGVRDVVGGTQYFATVRFELVALLSAEFREKWIEDPSYELYGISVGRSADVADVLCLCHRVLRLDVTSDTYRSLGLTGRKNTQCTDRYVIDLKLDGRHFRPGHRHFERVRECFEKCEKSVTMWMVGMKDGHPTEITGLQSDIQRETISYKAAVLHPLCRPNFPQRSASDPFWSDPAILHSILDWLGAMSLFIEDYPLSAVAQSPDYRTLQRHQWMGLLCPPLILKSLQWCQSTMRNRDIPWIAILVHGFLDAPLSFIPASSSSSSTFNSLISFDHAVLDDMSGENDFVILLLPDDQFCLFVVAGNGESFRSL